MNREDVLGMKAGRELDALVAKYVMQLDMVDDTLPQLPKYYLPEYERTIFRDVPLYSSDISAVWEVVEELNGKFSFNIKRLGDYFYQDPEYGWQALFTSREALMVTAKTAPEAICKAALLSAMEE